MTRHDHGSYSSLSAQPTSENIQQDNNSISGNVRGGQNFLSCILKCRQEIRWTWVSFRGSGIWSNLYVYGIGSMLHGAINQTTRRPKRRKICEHLNFYCKLLFGYIAMCFRFLRCCWGRRCPQRNTPGKCYFFPIPNCNFVKDTHPKAPCITEWLSSKFLSSEEIGYEFFMKFLS